MNSSSGRSPCEGGTEGGTIPQIYEDADRRLDAAVSLGLITAEQAAQIRALTPLPTAQASSRAATASSIGYVLGAVTVLIAMAWFLADRWEWLGAGGALAVVVLYAAMFLLVARRLTREGFATAAGFAVFLAVAMVPVGVVALNELTQWVVPIPPAACDASAPDLLVDFDLWGCRSLELIVELSTLGAALIALRASRFPLLVLPIAGILVRGCFHLGDALTNGALGGTASSWTWVVCASLAVAAAYTVDRAQRGPEDFGLWLHLVAVVCAIAASSMVLGEYEGLRHLLIPGAFVAFAFALRMRRFIWVLLGLGWFVSYLAWLASEVFRDTPVFPIVLAALGLGVIIATVWIQRNSDALVRRFGALSADGRPSFPGGAGLLLAPALVAALHFGPAVRADEARQKESRLALAQFRREVAREARARADSSAREQQRAAPAVRETPRPTPP